jgi:hypothetical protein
LNDRTLGAEVLQISPDGLRVRAGDREYTLAFARHPALETAPITGVLHVEMPDSGHLLWPDLGVTIAIDTLEPLDPLWFLK